ncbi:MAG: 2-oxo acid dehydrogenase subunit E2, partial [Vicinamibacterales bacterium]
MSTNIVVPELGESVVEARVARWLKKQGDSVVAGDALVELETEKIDLEVSADRAGVLGNIKHQEGADVKVGEILAVLEEAANGAAAAKAPAAVPPPEAPRAQAAADKKSTPTARNVAKAHDVKIESVAANGPRVTKQDVLKAATPVAKPAALPAPPAQSARPAVVRPGDRSETRERMSKRRATIARRLVEAQHTAAMLTTFNEVDMTAVMALRERRKEAFTKQHGVGLGIASFFVKAALGALKAFPQINAEIQGDEIVFKHYYDIGMAVGAEGGLVV